MALVTPAIDYNAVRVALIRATRLATGLDQNHAITLEAEVAGAMRPSLPYMALKMTGPGKRLGIDATTLASPGQNGALCTQSTFGPREMTAMWVAYASSHEDAASLAATMQAALDVPAVLDVLSAAGISVFIVGNVTDASQLLNTGYEGRSQLTCTMGLQSTYTVQTSDVITQADVQGNVATDQDPSTLTVAATSP